MIDWEYVVWGKQIVGFGFSDAVEAWRVLPSMERYPDIRDLEVHRAIRKWFVELSQLDIVHQSHAYSFKYIANWFRKNAQFDQIVEEV